MADSTPSLPPSNPVPALPVKTEKEALPHNEQITSLVTTTFHQESSGYSLAGRVSQQPHTQEALTETLNISHPTFSDQIKAIDDINNLKAKELLGELKTLFSQIRATLHQIQQLARNPLEAEKNFKAMIDPLTQQAKSQEIRIKAIGNDLTQLGQPVDIESMLKPLLEKHVAYIKRMLLQATTCKIRTLAVVASASGHHAVAMEALTQEPKNLTPFELPLLTELTKKYTEDSVTHHIQMNAQRILKQIPQFRSIPGNFHQLFLELAKTLGYGLDSEGICHGIATIGLIASAKGRLTSLNSLFEKIAQFAHQHEYDIEKIKAAFNKPENQEFSKKCHQLFQDIDLAQTPQNYIEKFPDSDLVLITQKLSPAVEKAITGHDALLQEIIDPFSGSYTHDDLVHILGLFEKTSTEAKAPIQLLVSNSLHTLAIVYAPDQKQWFFLDANQLPILLPQTTKDLATLIFHGLPGDTTPTVLSMHLFSTKGNFLDPLLELTHSKRWEELPYFQPHPERLLQAIMNKELSVVQKILEMYSDIKLIDFDHNNLLICAIINDSVEIVKALINKGIDVNLKNNEGDTALMFAAFQGNLEIVNALIDSGADVNLKNNEGDTALMFAASRGLKEMINVLKKKGALS